jgi:beta-lactamase superfamily II metal-dependent hydrolase
MRIEIFNVGHGQCAVLTAPNGRRMMFDCGDRWGDDRFWTPSLHFFRQTIDLLGLMNLDEDHLRDFRNVMRDCTVPWILSNPTVGPREFAALKKDGMGPGAEAVAAWLAQPKNPLPGPQPDFGDVHIRWYYPFYLPGAENKTNDLSLAVIAQLGTFKILFTGDLEVAGWRRLLTIPAFRQDVLGVVVFVASHHGRESGCCTELFELFRPQLVIISDDERQYDSQETDDWYRTRCTGAVFVTNERRYVATTRKDGSMRIDVRADASWTIERVAVRDWPRSTAPPQPPLDLGALTALGLGQNPLAPGVGGLLSHLLPVPPTPSLGLLNPPNTDEDSVLKALGFLPLASYSAKR